MLQLHDYYAELLSLPQMLVRSCVSPRAGIQLEMAGVYDKFQIDALDASQYPKLLSVKDLLQQFLFESRSGKVDSLFGQYWQGAKYTKSSYSDETPRMDITVDYGAHYYTFSSGPQMMKNAGPDSNFKDRLIFKVSNAPGQWRLDLEDFSKYLQERGVARPHEKNKFQFEVCDAKARLENLLVSVPPQIVMTIRRAALTTLENADTPQMLTWIDKDNNRVLEDMSASVGLSPMDAAALVEPTILSSDHLRQFFEFSGWPLDSDEFGESRSHSAPGLLAA